MLVLSRKKAIQDAYNAGRQAGIDYACEEFKWSIVSPEPIHTVAAAELRAVEQRMANLRNALEREINYTRRRAYDYEQKARGHA